MVKAKSGAGQGGQGTREEGTVSSSHFLVFAALFPLRKLSPRLNHECWQELRGTEFTAGLGHVDQHLLNLNVHQNHLGVLLKCPESAFLKISQAMTVS